jgi:hypothetical protein
VEIDRRILIRIALAVLVVGFILLIGKVTIMGFTRGAHDTSKLKSVEFEAASGAKKTAVPHESITPGSSGPKGAAALDTAK